jgi:hypothetical protein
MGLANLTFVPDTPADFQRWSFSNQASHRDIMTGMTLKTNCADMTLISAMLDDKIVGYRG